MLEEIKPETVDEVIVVESEELGLPVSEAPKKTITIPAWINRKNIIIAVAVLLVLGLAFYYKGLIVAATVNGQPITRVAVVNELEKTSGKTTLDAMINDKLISMEATKRNITVSDSEINAEFTKIDAQLAGQGQTLDQVLQSQGVSRDDIKKRIILQLDLEKMLGDKVAVSDAEVTKYIADNKITLPKGKEADTKAQISDSIKANKLSTAAQPFIDGLKANAKINYWVNY